MATFLDLMHQPAVISNSEWGNTSKKQLLGIKRWFPSMFGVLEAVPFSGLFQGLGLLLWGRVLSI